MEEKGLIVRKKNPVDGRGVIIQLTRLGKEKRDLSRDTVLKFNDIVKQHVPQEKLDIFMEVADKINELIAERMIYGSESTETDE
jgi:DNA-binding MarR family transcriptional regulator